MKNFLDYTKDVQNIKSGFVTPMWWILKYIQEEDNLYINQNFFEWKKIITESDIDYLKKLFDEKLHNIKSLKKELIESNLKDIEKKFILNSLNSIWLKYILFKNSVYLEAEKAWFNLTNEQRVTYLYKINRLQNIIYWPEISSLDSEKNSVLDKLTQVYRDNNKKLDEDEKQFFLDFLNSFDFDDFEETFDPSTKQSIALSKKYLSSDKVILLFEMVIDLYNLDWWTVFLDQDVWSFSVKKEKKQIVLPSKKLEKISLKRILELFDHEIWVHAIRWFNSTQTLKTNGDWYLEIEEWMATLSELLFDEKIENVVVEPTIHHISTFFAENMNWEDTKKMLEIYFKMIKSKIVSSEDIEKEAFDRMLRVKRFVSLKEKWANRKDVSYTRWQSQIVEFFQNNDTETRWQFIKDFYFAKLAFEDIWLVKEFRESLDIDESELKYPLWIWKILYKKLLWEKITLDWLQEEDFRFQIIEELSIWVKRKIVKILQEVRWKKK